MKRQLTTLFLVLCMCWQGLGCAGVGPVLADAGHLAHAVMHCEGFAHPQDAPKNGGIHQNDLQDSVNHLMEECCSLAQGLTSIIPLWLPTLKLDLPVASLTSAALPPFIDGPERPPRLAS